MATDEVKDVLMELANCEAYSKWLKAEKGIDKTPEQCYDIMAYFGNYGNWADMVVPQRMALFDIAHNIVTHWNGCTDQMNQLFELYYTIKYGINPLPNGLKL